jgi:hypothetical protein
MSENSLKRTSQRTLHWNVCGALPSIQGCYGGQNATRRNVRCRLPRIWGSFRSNLKAGEGEVECGQSCIQAEHALHLLAQAILLDNGTTTRSSRK